MKVCLLLLDLFLVAFLAVVVVPSTDAHEFDARSLSQTKTCDNQIVDKVEVESCDGKDVDVDEDEFLKDDADDSVRIKRVRPSGPYPADETTYVKVKVKGIGGIDDVTRCNSKVVVVPCKNKPPTLTCQDVKQTCGDRDLSEDNVKRLATAVDPEGDTVTYKYFVGSSTSPISDIKTYKFEVDKETSVTVEASDKKGLVSKCTQKVKIEADQPPTIECDSVTKIQAGRYLDIKIKPKVQDDECDGDVDVSIYVSCHGNTRGGNNGNDCRIRTRGTSFTIKKVSDRIDKIKYLVKVDDGNKKVEKECVITVEDDDRR